MRSFRSLVEQQIAKARSEGKLSGLDGEGHPLPDRPVETSEAAATSAGVRIMAEAGVLPEEFRLKKQLDAARLRYADGSDKTEQRRLMQEIADLELRYGIAREARRKFML